MAKLERGAKSAAIRKYLASNPQAGPNAVVAGLKAEGVTVKAGLVSAIKYGKATGKKSLHQRRATTVTVAARKTTPSALTFEQLIEVKRFADSVGGLEQVRQAIEMLEQLR